MRLCKSLALVSFEASGVLPAILAPSLIALDNSSLLLVLLTLLADLGDFLE